MGNKTRRLTIDPLLNLRDLGGYPTASGGTTKFGVFIRSEAPCELPQSSVQRIKAYGITGTVDLRGESESRLRPSSLETPLPYHLCPVSGGAESFSTAGTINWGQVYIGRCEDNRQWVCTVLDLAAKEEGGFLFHCTTGKDRTGIIASLLLGIAGVDHRDIQADYCVSEVYLQPLYARIRLGEVSLGRSPDHAYDDSLFQTPYTAIKALLDYLDTTYGGILPYLTAIGVSESTIECIRCKFVEA